MANKVHKAIDQQQVDSAVDVLRTCSKLTMGNTTLLNDTNINAITTGVAGLKTIMKDAHNNGKTARQDLVIIRRAIKAVTEMEDFGLFTDSNINGITTGVAGLIGLISPEMTTGDDSSKPFGISNYTCSFDRADTQLL